jgi:tripartite ATP-independent transporter DctM subunit
MMDLLLVFIVSFLVMLLLHIPIAVAIALASFLALLTTGADASFILASKMANGIDSFTLLAIPFFILAGFLMGEGGMARRLMDFASALVGRFPGGMAYANTLTCMLFGSVSGSAAAAVSSVGSFMIPEMNKRGYPKDFTIALTSTAATTGLVIPPSNVMIVYAVAAGGVSIADLFLAGILPGILIGLSLACVCLLATAKYNFPAEQPTPWRGILVAFKKAILSLLLIVIILGGILSGIYTATEASAIAVAYAFFLSIYVYKAVSYQDLPRILLKAGITTAVVMILIGASTGMSWMLSSANIPQMLSDALITLSENKWVILITINLLLLFVGIFLDITPALLIFTPILLPVARELGITDIQFGIMMIANLCIGLCTPPVGTCLFVGCSVGKSTVAKVAPYMVPFFIAMFISVLAIAYIPWLTNWLPSVLR